VSDEVHVEAMGDFTLWGRHGHGSLPRLWLACLLCPGHCSSLLLFAPQH